MVDKISSDAKIYNDVQGLESLRYQSKANPNAAKKEVAQQFEAMMMQMVMRSMRDANKTFSSDLFGGNDQMDFYQDMFDKQLTMLTSGNGNSVAQMIEKNIDQQYAAQHGGMAMAASESPEETPLFTKKVKPLLQVNSADANQTAIVVSQYKQMPPAPQHQTLFNSPEEFVKTLWTSAKSAAKTIGVDPKVLLAQAALETNWGKKILPQGHADSSYSLFNIKADPSWNKQTTTMPTLEQKEGVLTKEVSKFRSYESFTDSFQDYVKFLKENPRYGDALNKASNPEQFVKALQQAGFATDSHYADKILKVFSSQSFKAIVTKLEENI